MLPQPEPLIEPKLVTAPFIYPRSKHYLKHESWENGASGLSDPSGSMFDYAWYAWTDGTSIWCKREDLDTEHLLITDDDITEVDLTFDQNMRPCVAYVAKGVAKLNWYNAESASQVTTEYSEIKNPRVSLDDKRHFNIANSDIIFAYTKGRSLYYRLQRERYSKEHLLATDDERRRRLFRIGMSRGNRFLFYWF